MGVVVKSMDHCPICDVAVRPENLVRHLNDIHPRHPDTPKLVEGLKAEPGHVSAKRRSAPFRLKRWQTIAILLTILFGVGIYFLAPYLSPPPPVVPCVSGSGTAYHWHTYPTVTSAGTPVMIPANIGISFTCMELLHTHEGSNPGTGQVVIHIEPDTAQEARTYTIGEFFAVWGKPFGSPTRMLQNGNPITPSPTVGLVDQETLVIEYASFSA